MADSNARREDDGDEDREVGAEDRHARRVTSQRLDLEDSEVEVEQRFSGHGV